jgi:hypothetical protein
MSEFSPYPRRAYVALFRGWAQRNLKLLVLCGVGVIALLAFETALMVLFVPASGFRWWFLGALQTAVVAAALHLINTAFLAHEREAIWQLRGAWGEEATRDELRRAKKKRIVWDWVDSINLQVGDLDHVVVTRNCGLIAVDSKWRSDGRDADAMAESAARARLRAEGVARSLLKAERGSHRARGHAVTVRPLVVIWGPAQHQVPDEWEVNGIPFVGGRRLQAWLEELDGEEVSEHAANELMAELRKFRVRTHEAQDTVRPPNLSPTSPPQRNLR